MLFRSFYLNVFETEKFANDNKLSIQVAARQLRYDWFANLQKPNHYLATAHHKNDNIETVLFNFFRGTGLNGLTGIQELDSNRKIIRPLLIFSKEEILEFANQMSLEFVEDSSNLSNKYTRNSFRNQIIPLVKNHFENAEENIFHNINKLNDVAKIYKNAVDKICNELIEIKEDEILIPILKLKKRSEEHTSELQSH